MKKIGSIILVFLLAAGLTACGQTSEKTLGDGSAKERTVVFATEPAIAPFSFKENGKLKGFDIEIVQEIAKEKHYKVQWREMKFDGLITSLQSKQVDGGVAAITIRDDRKKVINFTDPYYHSGLVLVTKKESAIKLLDDLKGKMIVAKQGSSGLEKANELKANYGADVKVLEDEPTLYMDVEKGRADALVNDLPFVMSKIHSGTASQLKIVGKKLTTEDYGIAIAKDETQLLKDFNNGLAELKKNGKYDQLYEKYFGTKPQ
ncbi:MAG: basic amino acid ABC transporter substrate-binding protein [Bacillales bacterium]|nr:basic amino acid ABC transporter substrate-binding protein [Bacillales bacterium]